MAKSKPLILTEGHSLSTEIFCEVERIVRKPITSITAPNGCALIHAPGHEVKDGWRVAVTNAKGMTKINADLSILADADDPQHGDQYHVATRIDADHVELNRLNVADFGTHTANTGFLHYNAPRDITDKTYRLRVRDRKGGRLLVCTQAGTTGVSKPTGPGVDGTVTWATGSPSGNEKVWVAGSPVALGDVVDLSVLASNLAEDAPLNVITLTKNTAESTLLLTFTVAASILLSGKTGYFDLEEVTPGSPPSVIALFSNTIEVIRE